MKTCQAQKAESTDSRTKYAVKYATARGHPTFQRTWNLRLSAFAHVCLRSSAFVNAPFYYTPFCGTLKYQKFQKGVGGQRGLAPKNLDMPGVEASFLHPFFLCPLRRRGRHFWRTFLAVFGGLLVANSLPPSPFSKRLKEDRKKGPCPQGVLLEGGPTRDFLEVAFSSSFLGILAPSAF